MNLFYIFTIHIYFKNISSSFNANWTQFTTLAIHCRTTQASKWDSISYERTWKWRCMGHSGGGMRKWIHVKCSSSKQIEVKMVVIYFHCLGFPKSRWFKLDSSINFLISDIRKVVRIQALKFFNFRGGSVFSSGSFQYLHLSNWVF